MSNVNLYIDYLGLASHLNAAISLADLLCSISPQLTYLSAQQYCSRLGLESQVLRLQEVLVVTIWEQHICEQEKERKY